MFARLMMRSTLFEIVKVSSVNKENDSYEKYMAPATDNETQCFRYCFARRTVTDNHVQEPRSAPHRESLVQCEGEYHTVKKRHADPCDIGSCPAELGNPVEKSYTETYIDR